MVSKELAVIRERWKASSLIDFDERQAAELEKIDTLEVEYWQGFQRSKLKKTTITTRKIPVYVDEKGFLIDKNGEASNSEIVTETSVKEEARDGDPKWIDGMQRCIDMRLKIFGLYKSGFTRADMAASVSITDQDTKIQMALLLSIFDYWEEGAVN